LKWDTKVCHTPGVQRVSGYSHLYRRGAAYWFRRRVPTDLLKVLGKAEWKESLGTKNLEDAKRLCRERGVATDQEIKVARARAAAEVFPPLTPQEARALADEQLARWLMNDEEARISGGVRAQAQAARALEAEGSDSRVALAEGDWTREIKATEAALQGIGRWYARSDPSFRLLAFEMLKARVRKYDGIERRQRGEIVEAPPVTVVPQAVPGGVSLGQLIDAYREERVKRYGDEATNRKYAHVFRALEEGLGRDRPIRSITRADCRALRDLLAGMPTHMAKRYPGLTIEQASASAAQEGVQLISDRTLWSYMTNLSAVFNWGVEEEWLEKNPAKGVAERGTAKVKRRGFTPAELTTLFASLDGDRDAHPWRFWIPAVALYSGARAGELAQLLVGDIKRIEGRYCFDLSEFDERGIRKEGKRLKTEASERLVPIHPALIRAGFLRFVLSRGHPSDRLFPELKKGPSRWPCPCSATRRPGST
jgi:integrase